MHVPWKHLRTVVSLAAFLVAVPAAAQFIDVTDEVGLTSTGNSTGAAWGDFNGDGCVDLIVTGHTQNFLYQNDCDGGFTDVAAAMGITGPGGSRGVAWGDFDNDDDLDVYIASEHNQNVLYRNDGGIFADVTAIAGVGDERGSYGISWADLDADGDLDLFVANRFENQVTSDKTDRLYNNRGDGTFVDVGPVSGIGSDSLRNTFMGVWFDYDNNGTLDLYLSVDFGDDILYRNNGDRTFTDVSAEAGIADPQHGMGIAVGDPNSDGCFEVYITNNEMGAAAENDTSVLYRNNCDGTFTNISTFAGIPDREVVEWGANFVDIDNDQDEDLSVVAGGMLTNGQPNILHANTGGGFFFDVTEVAGVTNNGASFGSVWADYDGDGDLDWFVVNEVGSNRLFQNQTSGNNYLKVRLHGVLSNTYGVGARLDIPVPGAPTKTTAQVIQAGHSYLGSEELIAFFGVGDTTTIPTLQILWPSGVLDLYTDIATNQTFQATEGRRIQNGGIIQGITRDPLGDPEGQVKVGARHRESGVLFRTLSAPDGSYVLPNLLPGNYNLRAAKAGFLGSLRVQPVVVLDGSDDIDLQLR